MKSRIDLSGLGNLNKSIFKDQIPDVRPSCGRLESVVDDYLERTHNPSLILSLIEAIREADNNALLRLMILLQYQTARDGGIHVVHHISIAQQLGVTPTQWYYFILMCYDVDSIKWQDNIISWRVSELNVAGIKEFENKLAAREGREPRDLFADNYVRKLEIVPSSLTGEKLESFNKLNRYITEDYIDFITHGQPINNPEEFFI